MNKHLTRAVAFVTFLPVSAAVFAQETVPTTGFIADLNSALGLDGINATVKSALIVLLGIAASFMVYRKLTKVSRN